MPFDSGLLRGTGFRCKTGTNRSPHLVFSGGGSFGPCGLRGLLKELQGVSVNGLIFLVRK